MNTQVKIPVDPTIAMQAIAKSVFTSAELAKAGEAVQNAVEIVTAAGGKVQYNFDPEKGEIPAGYGIAIIPTRETDKTKQERVVIGVGICAVPDMALLMSTAEGAAWVENAISDAIVAKCANAIRPRKDGSVASSIPFAVEDFITSNRAEGVLVAFNELAPAYIKVLVAKGIPRAKLSKDLFRNILASKAFAESELPIPQKTWEDVLKSMIAKAKEKNLVPGIMEDWLATREAAGMPNLADIDLAGLDFGNI